MLRVDLMQARPGMRLALPVQNPKAVHRMLLKAGYELTDAAIQRVGQMGIRSLWVSYPSLAGVEKYISLESLKVQQQVVAQIADTFDTAQGQTNARLDYATYCDAVRGMIDHIATHPATSVFLGEISESENYLLRHASTVTYLSVLMGMKLESYMVRERKHVSPAKAKEIVNLGVGAMLHDYGLTRLEPDVLERFEMDGDEADPAYREHPALGFRAVRGQLDPTAATVLLHHHQRFDGSGFAGGGFAAKSGHGIHVYARVVAVADEFDRLRRPINLPEQPTVAVLSAMLGETLRRRFDPEILRVLAEVVPPYAPGVQLRLSDGRAAVCVDHNVSDPCRPTVQTIPDFASVSSQDDEARDGETVCLADMPPSLYVAECDGQPVAEFNFGPQAIQSLAA